MKNILSLEAMSEWAMKKPADEEYYWADIHICPCGQYAREMGLPGWFDEYQDQLKSFWRSANEAAFLSPRTWGALAERLAVK